MKHWWACLLLLVVPTSLMADVVFHPYSLVQAEASLRAAIDRVMSALEQPSCRLEIKRRFKLDIQQQDFDVPLQVVDSLYYGTIENERGTFVSPVPWDPDALANNVCVTLKSGKRLNVINIPLDTTLLADTALLAATLLHEMIHFLQCESRFPATPEKMHEEVYEVMDVCARPPPPPGG